MIGKSRRVGQRSGFTVIEIVLVLAIAGLVFAMAIVAFPALQRNQRDTQRRNDYSMLYSQILTKYNGNSIALKQPVLDGIQFGDNRKDPRGNEYILKYMNIGISDGSTSFDETAAKNSMSDVVSGGVAVYYVPRSSCNENNVPVRTNDTPMNSFSIYGSMENGVYCYTGSF